MFVESTYELFSTLGYYVLMVNILCFIVAAFLSKSINSPLITFMCLALFNAIMKYAKGEMKPMFVEQYVEIVRHLWYIAFALCYLLCIVLIVRLHTICKVHYSKFTKTVLFASAILATVILIKYFLRMHLGIDGEILKFMYTGIINAINVTIAATSLAIVFISIKERIKG